MKSALAPLLVLLLAAGCTKDEAKPRSSPPPAPVAQVAPVATDVPVQGRRIDITVTKRGYTPDKVEVKAGEQFTLVFTRTENTECLAEVKLPSLGISKQLPLGKAVAIPLKADKTGEIGWICGMDMTKGAVVVL
jgi:plastocyanin domain-containing protein